MAYICDQMQKREIKEAFEALEYLIRLKRQNCIIYAWMELKKRDRKLVGALSSRAKSILSYRNSYKSFGARSIDHVTHKHYFLSPTPRHNNPRIDKSSTPHKLHTLQNRQANLSNSKSQGYLFPQQQEPPSRRSIFGIRHQGLQFDDNDEFEEIVIERLEKLEQDIAQMMHDKQMKERQQSKLPSSPIIQHKERHQQNEKTTVNAQGRKLIYRNRRKRFQGCLSDHQKTPKDTTSNLKDNICNIKYIPVSKRNNLHFQQINKQRKEQDNIIDNIDYFLVGKISSRIGSPKNELQFCGYQHHLSVDNLHYFPNNIDIRTVIEPRNSPFFRIEPDLQFSPIKRKHQKTKPFPSYISLLKNSSSDPKISTLF